MNKIDKLKKYFSENLTHFKKLSEHEQEKVIMDHFWDVLANGLGEISDINDKNKEFLTRKFIEKSKIKYIEE